MEQEITLNVHNKQEYPPMHTAEHILNQTMIRIFGCERSKSSHIERKKSKCDYTLLKEPTEQQISEIEKQVNNVIHSNLAVSTSFIERTNISPDIDISKLPENASEMLRIVKVGDYDICACIGQHVNNTSEIGTFKIASYDYAEGKLRLRFKIAK